MTGYEELERRKDNRFSKTQTIYIYIRTTTRILEQISHHHLAFRMKITRLVTVLASKGKLLSVFVIKEITI